MRIGISFVDLAMGGAQTFLVQLAGGLSGRGHSVIYYLYANRQDPLHANPTLLDTIDQTADQVKRPGDLLSSAVIQLDGYHSLRRKLPYYRNFSRCVETYHSLYSLRRSGPVYAPHRVAVSRSILQKVKGDAWMIPTGIPMPPPCPQTEKNFDIAILGRIHPVKQHLLFLQACENVFHRKGSLRVLLIGGHPKSSPYQEKVDARIRELRDLGVEVHLTGDVVYSSVFHWLCQSRLLMITSKSEGFGRMAVEGMASNLPIVSNPVGGLTEIVEDGKTGYFAKRDDPDSFADFALRMLDDPRHSSQLGNAGRKAVEERYSLATVLDAYEMLYSEIANQ